MELTFKKEGNYVLLATIHFQSKEFIQVLNGIFQHSEYSTDFANFIYDIFDGKVRCYCHSMKRKSVELNFTDSMGSTISMESIQEKLENHLLAYISKQRKTYTKINLS